MTVPPLVLALLLAAGPMAAEAAPSAPADGPGDRPATILSHRAALSLDPLSRVLEASDTMLVRYSSAAEDSSFVRLHPALVPVRLTVAGRESPIRFRSARLSWARAGGDVVEVVVEYRGRIDFPSEFSRVSSDRAVMRAEEILPWSEGPIDSGRLALAVPSDWEVFGAGKRLAGEAGDDGAGLPRSGDGTTALRTRTFVWNSPIPSIGWICAGRYAAPRAGSGPTSLFRIPRTEASDTTRDAGIVSLADSLLGWYGRTFAPYRYDRLDIVEVDDWIGGGVVLAIASPSLIMVKRAAFETDDPYNRVETVLPHEVAHQWWMGSVFPEPRAVALISEGLCEYSSVLFSGARGEAGSRDTLSRSPLLRPLISRVKRGTAIPLDTSVDIRSVLTQYLKGAYVHHMLRRTIGDGPFLRLLALFARRYEGKPAGIPEYRAVAEEVSGRDLAWFFDQWVAGKGLPALRMYNVRTKKAGGGWSVSGRLRVAGYERYTAVVAIEAETEGGGARTDVRIGLDSTGVYRNDVPFTIACPGTPSSVEVDPEGDLLLLRKLPAKLSDLRDPGEAILVTGSGRQAALLRSLAEDDSVQLTRQGWDVRVLPDTAATLKDLQRERVVLYGGTADNSVADDARASFPFEVKEGGSTINGETVSDSTLGLIQACPNPWLDEGILIRIEPFGPSARPRLRPHDASWVLVRGIEKIVSGTWDTADPSMMKRLSSIDFDSGH